MTATAATAPLLRVKDLTVRFTTGQSVIEALAGVSFELFRSEVLAVVGESGSGKTTLGRCLVRLERPTSGRIEYNGTNATNLSGSDLRDYRREVQMVFQDPFEALNPRQNVYAIVSTPIRHILGEKDDSRIRRTVSDLLNEMELEPSQVMDKFPHQLSGGERQRVNIARALAPKPNLLIADEPITMLDAAQRLSILKLLLELKKNRDLTLIMITHDLASAKVTSDRTLVMYRGKVVEVGRTIDVVTSPHHPYVELIMKSVPQVQKSLEPPSAKSLWSEESANVQGGCIFRLRCEYAQDLCTRVEPPLEEKSNSHFAACHFALNLDHSKS